MKVPLPSFFTALIEPASPALFRELVGSRLIRPRRLAVLETVVDRRLAAGQAEVLAVLPPRDGGGWGRAVVFTPGWRDRREDARRGGWLAVVMTAARARGFGLDVPPLRKLPGPCWSGVRLPDGTIAAVPPYRTATVALPVPTAREIERFRSPLTRFRRAWRHVWPLLPLDPEAEAARLAAHRERRLREMEASQIAIRTEHRRAVERARSTREADLLLALHMRPAGLLLPEEVMP